MGKQKIGRNAPCPCGSGKKYKHCCLPKEEHTSKSLDDAFPLGEILQAIQLTLNDNTKDINDAIERLKKLCDRPNLSLEQMQNIQLVLVQAYQIHGAHHAALEILEQIDVTQSSKQGPMNNILVQYYLAISYNALGFHDESCVLFLLVLAEIDMVSTDPQMQAGVLLEAGKAFSSFGDHERARECWEKALKFFEDTNDVLHFARTKSNLGNLLLKNPDESKQEEGIEILRTASIIKQDIGDISGLASNYCNLGLYYWKKKRYERAIAFTRKDLYLSCKAGNIQGIANTLCNLAQLYIDLKQPSSARRRLKEAKQIGEALGDQRLIALVDNIEKKNNEMAKEAGQQKEKLGLGATCRCGSGKQFQACCGRADFEPSDSSVRIDHALNGLRPLPKDMQKIVDDIQRVGREPTLLDIILRQTDEVKGRQCWSRFEVNDGWIRITELPDMANYHLNAAKNLAEEAQSEHMDFYAKALSCVILSVCALEAFINQVAFFLSEIQASPQFQFHSVPPELTRDVMKFQRSTELTLKWEIVGKALCGNGWSPPASLLDDFCNLVDVRNELVHFKSSKFEQVEPQPLPNQKHEVMRYVPDSVETRQISRSWPARLLTSSYATHCVHVAESMIDYLKRSYREARLDAASDSQDEDATT